MPRWSFLLLLAGCTFGSGTERPGKVATSANYYGTSTTWDTGGGTATWTTGTVTTYYGYTGTTTTGYYGYTTGYYGYTNYGYSSYYYTDEYYTEPTCECATLTITVTVDGVLAEPDDITIDIGTGRRGFGSVGGTGSNGVYSVDYCTDECVTEVTVGAVTQTLNCEDFLQGYVTGQCGQDAVLEFQFDGTATGTTRRDRSASRAAHRLRAMERTLRQGAQRFHERRLHAEQYWHRAGSVYTGRALYARGSARADRRPTASGRVSSGASEEPSVAATEPAGRGYLRAGSYSGSHRDHTW